MTKIADLEFVQNLTWSKVIGYSAIIATTLVSMTWTVSTRVIDSRLVSIEKENETLIAQNESLKNQLAKVSNNTVTNANKTESVTPEKQEANDEFEGDATINSSIRIKELDFIFSVAYITIDDAYFNFTIPNGETKTRTQLKIGHSFEFEYKMQKYKFILMGTDTHKGTCSYLIKPIN